MGSGWEKPSLFAILLYAAAVLAVIWLVWCPLVSEVVLLRILL